MGFIQLMIMAADYNLPGWLERPDIVKLSSMP